MFTTLCVIFGLCILFGWIETPEQRTARQTEELKKEMQTLIKLQSGLITPEQYAEKLKKENDPDYEDKAWMLRSMKPNTWYRADQCFKLPFIYIKNKRILQELTKEGRVKCIKHEGFLNEDEYMKL